MSEGKSKRDLPLEDAETMDIFELSELISALQTVFERRKKVEAKTLLDRLHALGVVSDVPLKVSQKGKRRPGAPKYRSHKNPALTWAGRGHLAKWLKNEMAETGKPLGFFAVNDVPSE